MPTDDFNQTRQLAMNALNQGKFVQAVGYGRRMTELKPRDPEGHFLLGMAQDANAQVLAARTSVETALSFTDSAEYLAHYGRILCKLKVMDQAADAADKALALKPKDALTLDTIGCVYSRLGHHEKAIPIFEQAVEKRPDHPQFRFNLATSRQFVGDFDAAEQDYEHLIKVAPGFIKAHTALSSLRTQTADSNHIMRLEQLLDKVRDPAAQLHIRYALAKECEDIGRDDEAFNYLNQANAARKAALGYDSTSDKAVFAAVKQTFAQANPPASKTEPNTGSPSPIFIIGLPRTGTTLVDRIISSHPDVESAGELQTLPVLIKKMSGSKTPVVLDEDTLSKVSNLDWSALGQRYVAESAAQRGKHPRFTDKLPLNFFNVGFIAKAFPNARVVCLRRNPMDCVWSNFKHLFATDFSYYNYSYDVRDTAEYVVQFNDLMVHWDNVYLGLVHHLCYEDLVSDFEPQVRALIAYLGLDWSEACLKFNENESAVATPSAVQVRNPIYSGSVGKWKRFEAHLGDAKAVFEQHGLAIE